MVRLDKFITESNILETITTCLESFGRKCNPDLSTLHICLAHWHLTSYKGALHTAVKSFPFSQMVVYSTPSLLSLFFDDGSFPASLNINAVLHMIAFWKYYMVGSGAFHCIFRELNDEDKPQSWKGPISDKREGVKSLSRKWKGSFGKCAHDREGRDF